ncbi:MAG: hypothetical protein ABUK01_08655 [Leptospirales bacterium]
MELFEFIPVLFLLLLGAGLLVYLGTQKSHPKKPQVKTVKPEEPQMKKIQTQNLKEVLNSDFGVFESFDYHGTKILNTDGVYTVIDGHKPEVYSSLQTLPSRYRKMMIEIDDCKTQPVKGKYYLENLNGKYFVRFPDGRKKKYKTYADIPDRIKKVMVG